MQITDEMVRIALDLQHQDGTSPEDAMRAALEAALGQFMLQYGDNVELQEAEQIGFNRSASCIEDLAAALRNVAAYDDRPASEHLEKTGSWGRFDEPGGAQIARTTLERWGLK